jgi:hypothetical protein
MLAVKNDVVKMDWDVNGFIENQYVGFIAAMHNYHGVCVVFQEGIAYTFKDEEGLFSMSEMVDLIKKSYTIHKGKNASYEKNYEMDDYDEYLELLQGEDLIEGNCNAVGLTSEDMQDMLKRAEDLSGYFREVVEDD